MKPDAALMDGSISSYFNVTQNVTSEDGSRMGYRSVVCMGVQVRRWCAWRRMPA